MSAIGFGATLYRVTPITDALVEIGEVKEIGMPGLTRDTVDKTHYKSPGRYREYIAGLRDAGEFSATIDYDSTNAGIVALLADFDSDVAVGYQIELADGTLFEMTALVTGFAPDIPMDNQIVAEVTWKITGAPVITAAS